MNGLNTLMLINGGFYITIIVSDQDGDITIPITINKYLYDLLKDHSEENGLIGIKGL